MLYPNTKVLDLGTLDHTDTVLCCPHTSHFKVYEPMGKVCFWNLGHNLDDIGIEPQVMHNF